MLLVLTLSFLAQPDLRVKLALKACKAFKAKSVRLAQQEPKVCKVPQERLGLLVLRASRAFKEMRGLQVQPVPKVSKARKATLALQDRPGQPVLQASWALLARLVPKAQLVLHLL